MSTRSRVHVIRSLTCRWDNARSVYNRCGTLTQCVQNFAANFARELSARARFWGSCSGFELDPVKRGSKPLKEGCLPMEVGVPQKPLRRPGYPIPNQTCRIIYCLVWRQLSGLHGKPALWRVFRPWIPPQNTDPSRRGVPWRSSWRSFGSVSPHGCVRLTIVVGLSIDRSSITRPLRS
jgi:hypothetical protein